MRRSEVNQQVAYSSDYFLNQMMHGTESKFSLLEHAPQNERRARFMNYIQTDRLPLTFCRTGISVPVKLEWKQIVGNEITFRSATICFNGAWIKCIGTMNIETMEGRCRFERDYEPPAEEENVMTQEDIDNLRRLGLPV